MTRKGLAWSMPFFGHEVFLLVHSMGVFSDDLPPEILSRQIPLLLGHTPASREAVEDHPGYLSADSPAAVLAHHEEFGDRMRDPPAALPHETRYGSTLKPNIML